MEKTTPYTEFTVRLTLLEDCLGMTPSDPKIHEEFIASKAPDAPSMEEEVEAMGVEAVVEKGMTVFPRLADGTPFLWDYQIRGMFKDACGMLRRVPKTKSSQMKAYKKIIDGNIFVQPRKIPFTLSGELGNMQRPLRASTPQGERVALANSETIPAGSSVEFKVICMNDADKYTVLEWLDYGKLRGLGQWRNASWGIFDYDIVDG
jgi:hypothetical protein